MDAGALFARLSDIVRQCLELEIRIDEELRRLEAAMFVTRGLDATLGGRIGDAPRQEATRQDSARQYDARQYDARNRIGAMVEAVIEEEAKTRQEASRLYAALRERLDGDEAYRDLAGRPDVVHAGSLCRALGLRPNPSRWAIPPPDP
jgi:hypothetical protein